MICELFPFQQQAVNDLRTRAALALNNYKATSIPQVISLQAPTGSGKTIIMSAFIEDIYSGNEYYVEQPEAIFVWLSDSPQLNIQSKEKIENKADKIKFDQCVFISDENGFDQEILDDGKIYFLNTQKLGKGGNLNYNSDERQYTIWQTIENTIKNKSDRLYFIIDEAHRGMQGRSAGTATTIMQRFIKGSSAHGLSPVPVVIGMSATAERFNALVGNTTSSLQKVVIPPERVRASGLLKDRIVITYPEDPTKHNDMAVLQAATDEWIDKCLHWKQYTVEQHYANVNPVFVVQVAAGNASKVSTTDLDDVLQKIEERVGEQFSENEVVHTFGQTGTISINGLNVPHVEPSEIADNRKIKLVLFKENLSTGWDCPRAETMMSFRHAEDATYIAQLLGRMVRTPLQCHIMVDDSLNDVRLYLPYFNKDTVKEVINELQATEGGDIPTVIDGESLEDQVYVPWTVHTSGRKPKPQLEGQIGFAGFDIGNTEAADNGSLIPSTPAQSESTGFSHNATAFNQPNQHDSSATSSTDDVINKPNDNQSTTDTKEENTNNQNIKQDGLPINESGSANDIVSEGDSNIQVNLYPELDREAVIKFINEQGFLTYIVRQIRISSYLKSLLSLAGLLTHTLIYPDANDVVKNEVSNIIRNYIEDLHKTGKYDSLAKQVLEFKLQIQVFDPFGESLNDYGVSSLFEASETDLDRQLRAADAKLGGYGFPFVYGRKYIDFDDPNAFKIDCILFAADDDCMNNLNKYAEKKFHELNDKYRKYVVSKSEKCQKQYSDIIANGDIVSKHNFSLPETISAKIEKGGVTYHDHLFADLNGDAVIKLNNWESGVLEEEQKRNDYVCWFRNEARKSWSLTIPYEIDNETRSAYPDFIVIRKDPQLGFIMDILEPHNPDFKDNLGKAKGFAKYAIEETRIGRVQLIRLSKDMAGNNRFKRLDMSKGEIRNKVLAAINNDELDHIFDIYGEFQD